MPVAFDSHPLGLTWTVAEEALQRSSHALAADGRVWLVDPVDDAEALERVVQLGAPAGVIQLLDRHNRAGEEIAARLGVPHLRLPASIPGSPFEVVRVVDVPRWREVALWWARERALVVAEAIGTGKFFGLGAAPAGVHMFLRPFPPGALRAFEPEHLLCGHGPPLHGPAAAEGLHTAYARSRRDLVKLPALVPAMLRSG